MSDFPHRQRWRFVEEHQDLEDFFGQVFETLLDGKGRALKHEGAFHAVDGRGDFMCSFLVEEGTVFSVYPYVEEGALWPITVAEAKPGPTPLEGRVTGRCQGLPVGLFDTLFFRHQSRYPSGDPLHFSVSALATSLSAADNASPHVETCQGDGADEITFVATIDSARPTKCWDYGLTVYGIALPTPEGPNLSVEVYVAHSDEDRPFKEGDVVAGRAWLFGQIPPVAEDDQNVLNLQ
jgi:hypothetical protein